MTPLRQQMHDAMLVRGLAERTRQTYIETVARLAIFYHQNPADLSSEQLDVWLLHLIRDRKLSYSTLAQAAIACRFFYGTVLKGERAVFPVTQAEWPWH
jgi:integrase/recombinase XerD